MVKAGYVLEVLEFITEEEGDLFLYEQNPSLYFRQQYFLPFSILYKIIYSIYIIVFVFQFFFKFKKVYINIFI